MPYFKDFQESWRHFFKDKIISLSLIISLIGNVSLWGLLTWRIIGWPELIPLHYTIYFGIDLFGPWYQIFILPLIGSLVIIVNFILAAAFYLKEKIGSYFLVITTAVIQILLIIAGRAITAII